MIRRLKKEVLSHLPPKVREIIKIEIVDEKKRVELRLTTITTSAIIIISTITIINSKNGSICQQQ